MKLPEDPNKYLSQFRYVELARFVPSLNKVIREQKNKEPILVDINEVSQYAESNKNTGIYTSVFQYKSKSISDIALGPMYFDFDSTDIETARQQVANLKRYFEEDIQIPVSGISIYFTGSKGFHLELEPITLGITPASNLPEIFRFIATSLRDTLGLSTLDFAVYDHRRMWRLPNTRHQYTNLYKCEISGDLLNSTEAEIREFASNPISKGDKIQCQESISEGTPVFSMSANEWWRTFSYQMEESLRPKYTQADIIDRFQKRGSSDAIDPYSDRIFDPINLFENCPSIQRLWTKSEQEHNLEHEERLFLCSILTYTDEAISYLHAILSNCDDYNFERSESHIRDWISRREKDLGGRPYSCKRANAVGVGCGDCDERLEQKPKYERIGDKLYPTEEKAEVSPIRFAYTRSNNA